MISYDLTQPGQNYVQLGAALEGAGAQRVLASQWIGRWNGTTAASLRDHFRQHMDASDRVLVTCLDRSDWAGRKLMEKISEM